MKHSTRFMVALSAITLFLFVALAYPHGGPGHDNGNGHGHHHHDGDPADCVTQHPFEEFDPAKDGNIVVWFENNRKQRYALRVVKGQKIRVYSNAKRLDFFHGDSYRRIFYNHVEVEIGKKIGPHNFTSTRR